MPSDSKPNSIPSGNMKTSPWLDTSPHMLTRQPKPSIGNGQQPNKTPLVRPEFQRDRSPVHARPSDPVVRQPALRDPALRYPDARDTAGRDPAGRDPAIRYPDARDPARRDPAIRYPDARNTAGRDPAIRYPDVHDPTGRDPAIRYPDARDSAGRDPAIRYPDARDSAGRDPTVRSPGGRNPALVRPNRFNPMARPERPSRHRSPPAQPSVPSPTPIRSSTQPRWRQQPVRQSPPRGPKPEQTARTNISPNNVREPSPEGWVDPPAMDKQAPRQPSRETNTNWNALNGGQRNVPRPQWNQFQQPRQHNRVVKKPENNVHRSGQQTGPATIHKVVRPAQPNRRVVPGPSNFNNVARPQQQDWRANSGSPKVNNVGSKVPTQFPAGNSKVLSSVVGQGRPLMRPDSTSGPAGKNTVNSNSLPIKKQTHPIPFKDRQPVFKDINSALSSRSGDNSGNPPADWHTDTQPQAVVDHVTEKPVVDGTKVSKKPMMPDTSHVTVAMKLDVSDASVQSLKTNDWGNDLHRGDFVYKPKPTKVPRGHKSKGSVQNKWVNNPDTTRVNQEKPKRGRIETSTFSVIRPNSQTAHTGPAIIRPTKQNSHPWSNNNTIEAAGEGSNMHMKNIKNLIDQQRPSSVIKHFIEMTTENGLDASGSQGIKVSLQTLIRRCLQITPGLSIFSVILKGQISNRSKVNRKMVFREMTS
ncbi:pollen-specific leucine-rich repeat extensin-like protein 2 [Pecten maximus]|uniref:pollen-specific leucine-rich repeat extensin-like protein 2 n=1 Tax=Pecten maximus TaxID=6579 RepID=UPI001458918F|nr:pollen-specific leucine-rich repeat extensin-like protein 2 [Pecten maximus]